VCIGRDLDAEAAQLQLAACLLTADEMAGGAESWHALADPFAPAWAAAGGGGSHAHSHEHGAPEGIEKQVQAIEQLASAVTPGRVREARSLLRGCHGVLVEGGFPFCRSWDQSRINAPMA